MVVITDAILLQSIKLKVRGYWVQNIGENLNTGTES
jgi:hypothetical protein